ISLQCNMVANTYGNQLITAATAQGFVPSWWYDNVAYGPVSGGNHGGVYWDATANGRMTARFWNAACMNEVRQVYGAMYAALEPQGIHLYRIEPTMEISGAPAMISAGMTDQALIDVLVGTTGIPNGFAADMRLALPTSLLALCITFPRSQSNTPAILEAVLSHQWSFTNYDGCNESVPADLPTGKASSNWGDLAFCGQTSVNGPIVSKNYKALGYDHHNNIVADELGNGSAAVPNAIAGTGRLPDVISHCVYEGSSHFYIYSTNSGPPCNTTGSFSGQPANYKFPATGTVVTQTNSIAYLAALNVNSALHLTYPGAFG
ncbi:MAG: hypothetical protein JWO52_7851, partial [Gammaproteobacteria bacterium]|nr:hypothetical protein [Gammaproteobacteria bacterium]